MTKAQTEKQRSVLVALLWDVFCVLLLVVFALATHSLTLIGDALRSFLMVGLLVYNYSIMRAIGRGLLRHLEFGATKLEHFASILLAGGLVVSAAMLAETIYETILGERAASVPVELAVAAVIAAFNLLINYYNWLIVRSASTSSDTETYRAQLAARQLMLRSSLTLQATLTIAAISPDPFVSLTFDALGAAIVVVLVVHRALGLLRASLPVLLDAPASDEMRHAVMEAVRRDVGDGAIAWTRTRLTGDAPFVQMALSAPDDMQAQTLRDIQSRIERQLRASGYPIELSLVPVTAAGDTTVCPTGMGGRSVGRR